MDKSNIRWLEWALSDRRELNLVKRRKYVKYEYEVFVPENKFENGDSCVFVEKGLLHNMHVCRSRVV